MLSIASELQTRKSYAALKGLLGRGGGRGLRHSSFCCLSSCLKTPSHYMAVLVTLTTLKYVCLNHGDQTCFFNLKPALMS